jgi:DNA gyrase/topoisomerase IV subunit B
MKEQNIKQMDQISHCLLRPSMYIGSVSSETQNEFILQEDKFVLSQRAYTPGLIKLFNELIDNSIDEFVRTKGKHANKIIVQMDTTSFQCTDNGRGIPNTKMNTLKGDSKFQAEVAFTEMLSGANYSNDDEATIGTNGLGAKAASIFSKKSVIVNDDGKIQIKIITTDNLNDVKVTQTKSKGSGISTQIFPDLKYFELEEISETEIQVVKERLLHLSISYPEISFKFNGELLKINSKSYFDMFDAKEFVVLNENVSIAVTHSPSDQFEQFSLVNGLVTKSGGSHVNFLSNEIINPIREKLVKKHKTIKPGDIRQKLRVILIFKDFKNAKYTSQTKEEITNSTAAIKDYLGDYTNTLTKFVKKILSNDDVMLPITELFLLKEQAKENADLKKLNKGSKKIKSEKYLPATGTKKYLMITEGASATGGLMPVLGRKEVGYYELKGKPLNAIKATHADFAKNIELSELYKIIQTEGYQYIIPATDQDLDGFHIRGLLFGFIHKYLPEFKDKVGLLNTPVIGIKKGKTLQRWYYSLNDKVKHLAGETSKYYKGLGSHKAIDLKYIVDTDGLSNMIEMIEWDDEKVINDWLDVKSSDKRKEYIKNNTFSISKL